MASRPQSVVAALCEDHGCPSAVAPIDSQGALAVGTWDGFVATYRWDGASLVHLAAAKVFDEAVWALTVLPNGSVVAIGKREGECAVFIITDPQSQDAIKAVRCSADRAKVEKPASKRSRKASQSKSSIDHSDEDQEPACPLPEVVSAACISGPDVFCFGDEDGAVWIYDFDQSILKLRKRIALRDGRITSVIAVPAKRMLFAASDDGSFSVVDLRRLKAVAESKDYTEDIEAMVLLHVSGVDLDMGAFSNARLIVGTNAGRLAAHTWGDWGFPADGLLPRVHDRRGINNIVVVDAARGVVATLSDERVVRLVDCSKPLTASTCTLTLSNAQSLISGLCLASVVGDVCWLVALCSAETLLLFVPVGSSDMDALVSHAAVPGDGPSDASDDDSSASESASTSSSGDQRPPAGADFYADLD